MDLVGVEGAGQLGDALLVELVQAVRQPSGTVGKLPHTVVQGGHTVVEGLGAIGQLGAAVLSGVGTVRRSGHAAGVLANAGNEELDLRKAGLQGADIGDILAVLGLKLQLILHGLLGLGAGQ